jgi:hypothetical protein
MKSFTTVLAVFAVLGFVSTTMAQEKLSLLYGKVISVDAAAGKIVIAPKEGPQVTVTTDAGTKILVSGKSATLADVKPDMTLRVSPATGTAVDLRAFPAQPGK